MTLISIPTVNIKSLQLLSSDNAADDKRVMFTHTNKLELFNDPGRLAVDQISFDDSKMKIAKVTSTGHYVDLREDDYVSIVFTLSANININNESSAFDVKNSNVAYVSRGGRKTVFKPSNGISGIAAAIMISPVSADYIMGLERGIANNFDVDASIWRPFAEEIVASVDTLRAGNTLISSAVDSQVFCGNITKILKFILTESTANNGAMTVKANRRIKIAVEYLHANFRKPIYLGELAAAVGTSSRVVQLDFAAHFGMSPLAFLNEVRMQAAYKELTYNREQRLSIKSIAYGCGFRNMSRFSREFHKRFNILPSKLTDL